jgi:tetratricopeptide (TPR) repeat protein
MLFDLRARGRQRTIKIIYTGLAILMGFGLIGFGIGGNVSGGGLIDAITGNDDGGSGDSAVEKRIETANKQLVTNPKNAPALVAVARGEFQLANLDFDDTTGQYSDDGKQHLRNAGRAWDRYLALDPKNPDAGTARLMVQAFLALEQPAKAVTAQEVIVESQPDRDLSAGDYVQLAQLAWAAGQMRKGDLARDKAIDLAPKDQRQSLKAQLDQARGQSQETVTAQPSG